MGILKFFFDAMMAFVPPFLFVPQLISMKKEMNTNGYSKVVSLLFIVSNILRLCFRIGVNFSTALVLQSMLQISVQMYAVYEILKIQEKCDFVPVSHRQNAFVRKYLGDFWDWNEFRYYVIAVSSFGAVMFIISLLLSPFYWYFEFIGLVSTVIEAVLSLPQYLKNRRERSVEGLNILVVCSWACGDFFKLVYYSSTRQPLLFCWCSLVQLVIDSCIIHQFLEYSQKPLATLMNSNLTALYSAIPINYLPISIPPVGLEPRSETPDPDRKPDTDSEEN